MPEQEQDRELVEAARAIVDLDDDPLVCAPGGVIFTAAIHRIRLALRAPAETEASGSEPRVREGEPYRIAQAIDLVGVALDESRMPHPEMVRVLHRAAEDHVDRLIYGAQVYADRLAATPPAPEGEAGSGVVPRLRELAEGCRDSAALSEKPADEYPVTDFAELARHLDQLADLIAPAGPQAEGGVES